MYRPASGLTHTHRLCLILLSTVPLLGVIVLQSLAWIDWNIKISGHLLRASSASTTEAANEELITALTEVERRNLTTGSTHLFWPTPATDIGYWYRNLKAAQAELASLPEETSNLERTNILLKLRETIMTHSEKPHVLIPEAIYVYPNRLGYFLWCTVFGIVMAVTAVLVTPDD